MLKRFHNFNDILSLVCCMQCAMSVYTMLLCGDIVSLSLCREYVLTTVMSFFAYVYLGYVYFCECYVALD